MNLIPITAAGGLPGGRHAALIAAVHAANLAMYPPAGPIAPWMGYFASENGEIVGTCAFKTAPAADGVEIAYFTFPGNEGAGVATRMASELLQLAQAHGAAPVRAQTLPEESASTSILKKLGFRLHGSVVHPDDGLVWEWRR